MQAEQLNSQLGITINNKQDSKQVKFHSQSIPIPGLSANAAAIEQFQAILRRVGVEETEGQGSKKGRYVGEISGNFVVPAKHFSKPFSFKVPFSFKHSNGIALSFSTNDFASEKLNLLNKFVFGDEKIRPVVITKEIAVDIVTYLIESAKGFEKLKAYYQSALDFINTNNITFNLFIDHVQKKYQVGFFWQAFKLDGMPSQIQIQDIIFGLSVNSAATQNKFAVKVGGKGKFTTSNKTESNIYIEYSYDSQEQRLELGGSISILTSLLEVLGVDIPEQISDFAKNTNLSVEWVSDNKKKIVDQMKNGGK